MECTKDFKTKDFGLLCTVLRNFVKRVIEILYLPLLNFYYGVDRWKSHRDKLSDSAIQTERIMPEIDIDRICGLARDGQHEAVVSALIQDRGDLVHKTDQSGRTVLHWAAVGGNVETMKLILLNYGADPDVCDEVNWTPLMIASSAGKSDVVSLLLEHGASTDAQNSTGQSALHYAASKKRLEIAEMLLKKGASPNMADNYGSTPLHRAASQGHTSITKLLLNHCADPNATNSEGSTPLHLACEEDRTSDARLLIDAGADVSALNKEEKSPLMIAGKDLKQILQSVKLSKATS